MGCEDRLGHSNNFSAMNHLENAAQPSRHEVAGIAAPAGIDSHHAGTDSHHVDPPLTTCMKCHMCIGGGCNADHHHCDGKSRARRRVELESCHHIYFIYCVHLRLSHSRVHAISATLCAARFPSRHGLAATAAKSIAAATLAKGTSASAASALATTAEPAAQRAFAAIGAAAVAALASEHPCRHARSEPVAVEAIPASSAAAAAPSVTSASGYVDWTRRLLHARVPSEQ